MTSGETAASVSLDTPHNRLFGAIGSVMKALGEWGYRQIMDEESDGDQLAGHRPNFPNPGFFLGNHSEKERDNADRPNPVAAERFRQGT